MIAPESWLLSYLCNSLWQLPLLFAAGRLAARALRPAGPAAEHRVWVGVLLLASALPACPALPWSWLRTALSLGGHGGQAHVSVVMGAGVAGGALPLSGRLLAAAALAYALVSACFLARFLRGLRTVSRLRRHSAGLTLAGPAAVCWAACGKQFGIRDASVALSSQVFGPVTLGARRKLVLLPAGLVDGLREADLLAIFAHEFAHMRRRDFAKNLLYQALSLPLSYHPLLWLTRAHITETREMVCDRMAAQLAGPAPYAGSLLRLASLLLAGMPVRVPHAIGILDAHTFERRVMQLIGNQRELRGVRRAAVLAACATLGLGACGAALALGVHVDAAPSGAENSVAEQAAPHSLDVPPGVMAGHALTKVNPKYPEAAKKAKIEGSVVLDAVIGTDGTVKNLEVASGPEQLRQASLDAVRQWTYTPYLLNGNPVEVKTTVTVTYSLQP